MVLETSKQTDRHDNNNTLHHSRRGGHSNDWLELSPQIKQETAKSTMVLAMALPVRGGWSGATGEQANWRAAATRRPG